MAAYEILLLNTTIPQIQAAQSGDTYVVPRDIAFSTVASFAAGTAALPSIVATGDTNTGIWFPAADTFAVSTAGTERARIDSSGNLGLGVTPSTGGYGRAFQIDHAGNGGALTAQSIDTNNYPVNLTANAVSSGATTWKYVNTDGGSASRYQQVAGIHSWYTAASGTAGDPITFTQAMTLDASGNLLVGRTNQWSSEIFGVTGSSASQRFSYFRTTSSGQYISTGTNSTLPYIEFGNGAGLAFNDGGSERARITSGGEFLVGQTLRGLRDSNSFDFDVTDSSAYINHVTGSASGSTYVYFGYAAGAIGSISQNGTTGVLYNITSDYRLKDVVGAVTGAGDRIDALKPVDYTWKANGSAARGFLAHEFQAVYPNSVIGTKDAVDEEGKPIHQQMQASTSEVIADLVAELQSLRARVAQLEGK